MTESEQQFESPLNHEISKNALKLVIDGYVRSLKKTMNMRSIIPTAINQLFALYYPKQMYMIILNQKNLKLTLCDMDSTTTKLTSNDAVQQLDVGGTKQTGIAHKRNISIDNVICNVIFKVGGESDEHNWGTRMCGMIIYPQEIQPYNFNTYYCNLPELPETPFNGFCFYYNNPIYSETYGLILFGANTDTVTDSIGQIANLKLNFKDLSLKSLETFKSLTEWNVETVPNDIALKYTFPPNYCLINGQNELFIINGADENNLAHKQTSIYNLDTKKCTILKQNPFPSYLSAITYSNHKNKVYIGGGGDSSSGYQAFYYDLHKQEYARINSTRIQYIRPTIWLSNNDNILNIACIKNRNVRCEWIDLRTPFVAWTSNEKLNKLTQKIWNEQQFDHLSIIKSYSQ